MPLAVLDRLTRVISLGEVLTASHDVVGGRVQGRLVVDVRA